jgi:hypothetical protein
MSEISLVILDQRNAKFLALDSYEIGVHQIRIVCEGLKIGYPVPEGPHQDGFDYVAIYCINVFNAAGGVSSLYAGSKDGEMVYRGTLKAGDGLIVDDRKVFHYTSPIAASDGGFGFRDICVVTFKRIEWP